MLIGLPHLSFSQARKIYPVWYGGVNIKGAIAHRARDEEGELAPPRAITPLKAIATR
jgi:hypothetical protein